MIRLIAAVFVTALASFPAMAAHIRPGAAPPISAASINASAPNGKNDSDPSLIAKAEVLLDRDHFSPGEIDGMNGDNYRRALRAFQQANNLSTTGIMDADTWNALTSNASEPVLKSYTITDADLAGPFDKVIPVDLKQMAELHGLSYTSPLAELAEKFHMNMEFLRRLNPRAAFERPGQEIAVAGVNALDLHAGRDTFEAIPPNKTGEVANESAATIVVDKPARNLRAYDKEGKLLAVYRRRSAARKSRPNRRLQGARRLLEPRLHLRSEIRVERRDRQTQANHQTGAEQSSRFGLIEPDRSHLRDSWHAGAGESERPNPTDASV